MLRRSALWRKPDEYEECAGSRLSSFEFDTHHERAGGPESPVWHRSALEVLPSDTEPRSYRELVAAWPAGWSGVVDWKAQMSQIRRALSRALLYFCAALGALGVASCTGSTSSSHKSAGTTSAALPSATLSATSSVATSAVSTAATQSDTAIVQADAAFAPANVSATNSCIYAEGVAGAIVGSAVKAGGPENDLPGCWYEPASGKYSLNVSVDAFTDADGDPCASIWTGLGWSVSRTQNGCVRIATGPQAFASTGTVSEVVGANTAVHRVVVLQIVDEDLSELGKGVNPAGADSRLASAAQAFLATSVLAADLTPSVTATVTATVNHGDGSAGQCSGDALFAAAVAEEHLDPNDPGYAALPPPANHPTVSEVKCVAGWAVGFVDHPNTGTADAGALFHFVGASWVEVAGLGGQLATCQLTQAGVPVAVANVLVPPAQSAPSSAAGC